MGVLPFNEFLEKYPLLTRIGTGVYGKIYATTNGKIVKVQKIAAPLIKELTILSKYQHPGIYNLEDVSFHRTSGYFVIKKGILLSEALQSNLITIEEILSDLLETISFLHRNGIVHCDIKKANLLFDPDEKRVKVIDFGISRFGEYHSTLGFHFKGIAFSPHYRDPEFREFTNNQFLTELYSVAAVIYFLFHPHSHQYYFDFSFLFNKKEYFSNPNNILGVIEILNKCQSFLEKREGVETLLLHPSLVEERINLESKILLDEEITFSLSIDDDFVYSSLSELFEMASTSSAERNTITNTMYLFFKAITFGVRKSAMLMKSCYYTSLSLKAIDVAIPYTEMLDYYCIFQEISEKCGCSFSKKCNSYSLENLISRKYHFCENENSYLDFVNDSIYNFPMNYTSHNLRSIFKSLFENGDRLDNDISKIVVCREHLSELETTLSLKILKGILRSYNFELLKRLLGFDTTLQNYYHFLSDAQYNIFSFESEEEMVAHLSRD